MRKRSECSLPAPIAVKRTYTAVFNSLGRIWDTEIKKVLASKSRLEALKDLYPDLRSNLGISPGMMDFFANPTAHDPYVFIKETKLGGNWLRVKAYTGDLTGWLTVVGRLSDGLLDEAYRRYAIEANRKTTNLATFRAIAQKYPDKNPKDILSDLVASSPGEPGKWFAAAKSAGLYLEALELANRSPCDPKTLTRAARDMAETEPLFAIEAGMTALKWLAAGYGYDVTGADVISAYSYTMEAAESAQRKTETLARIREMVAGEVSADRFVTKVLGRTLGLNWRE